MIEEMKSAIEDSDKNTRRFHEGTKPVNIRVRGLSEGTCDVACLFALVLFMRIVQQGAHDLIRDACATIDRNTCRVDRAPSSSHINPISLLDVGPVSTRPPPLWDSYWLIRWSMPRGI